MSAKAAAEFDAVRDRVIREIATQRQHTLTINGIERACLQLGLKALQEKYGNDPESEALLERLNNLD